MRPVPWEEVKGVQVMNECNVCGRQTPYQKCNDCVVRGAKRERADVASVAPPAAPGELPPGVEAALDALDERVRKLEELVDEVRRLGGGGK